MHYIDDSMHKELQLMVKYQLTAEELFLVKLIFLAQEDHLEFMRTYVQECMYTDIIKSITNLVDKGVLLKTNTIPDTLKGFDFSDLIFNKLFLKNYLKYSYDMGMEIFAAYPTHVNIGGKLCSIKNISKNFNSFESFAFAYGKAIKFDEEKHKEVLEILEWAKEEDLIHYGICEFIISFKWMELATLRENGIQGIFKTNELI